MTHVDMLQFRGIESEEADKLSRMLSLLNVFHIRKTFKLYSPARHNYMALTQFSRC
jgi:hypothetical protein